MNTISINTLEILRKSYLKYFDKKEINTLDCEQNPEKVSDLIYNSLINNKPVMIGRFGANELNCVSNYLGVKSQRKGAISYIRGNSPAWWWKMNILKALNINAGFFPLDVRQIEKFCQLILDDLEEIDILGSWQNNEKFVEDRLDHVNRVRLYTLEPFWSRNPWSRALEGKNILVIHPFSETIENQYVKRGSLFKNKEILPKFNLVTIKAVQSIAGAETRFKDWFEALEYMKAEMDKVDYDICLIGAGAYGFPLAAHAKRKGKKGFHLGGSLQLLFGIKGKRWENSMYGKGAGISYNDLFNENWTRPMLAETPLKSMNIEDNCYW